MKQKVRRLGGDEGGQVYAIVLILLLIGALLITPLLQFMGTGIKAGAQNQSRMEELYAADAGVDVAAWNIKNGSHLPEIGSWDNVSQPNATLNGKTLESVMLYCFQKDPNGGIYEVRSVALTPGQSRTTVQAWIESIPSLWQNAITSTGNVTLQPGSYVNGNVSGVVSGTGGNVTQRVNGQISSPWSQSVWPFSNTFQAEYWSQVSGNQFAGNSIDVSSNNTFGGFYHNGNFQITNTGASGTIATLTGTVYVKGSSSTLTAGQSNHDYVLNLNNQTIFVEGEDYNLSTFSKNEWAINLGGKVQIEGSGLIIADGNINFQPNMDLAKPGQFVFVMSIDGGVNFQPGQTMYGSVAGQEISTGGAGGPAGTSSNITYTQPTPGLNFPKMPVNLQSAVVRSYHIGMSTGPGPVILTDSLPNAVLSQPYSAPLYAIGGTSPYIWSVSSGLLPPGLQLIGDNISGIPTKLGISTFTVQLTDHSGATVTQQLTITVGGPTAFKLAVTGPTPSTATAGVPYSFTVTAMDSDNNTVTGYTGTVDLTSSDPYATFSTSSYTFQTSDNGAHVFTVTFKTAGSQSIIASDSVYPTVGGIDSVDVAPGALYRYYVSPVTSPQPENTAIPITIQAQDSYGNNISSGSYASENVTVTFNPPYGLAPPVMTYNGTATVPVVITQQTTNQTVTFTGASGKSGTSNSFVVGPTGTISLGPSAEAYVDSLYPSTNYAGDQNLWVSKNGSELRDTFIEFDLTGLAGDNITNATLTLYDTSGSNWAQPYRVYKNWDDNVTWNTTGIGTTTWSDLQKSGSDYGNPAGTQYGVATGPGTWMSINVTQDVQYFANPNNNNYGWILVSTGVGNPGVSFAATGIYAPVLTITYQP